MTTKILILPVALAMLVATLGTMAFVNSRQSDSGYTAGLSRLFIREAGSDDDLSSPEMKRAIADINNRMAIVSVARWDATVVRKASDHVHAMLKMSPK